MLDIDLKEVLIKNGLTEGLELCYRNDKNFCNGNYSQVVSAGNSIEKIKY